MTITSGHLDDLLGQTLPYNSVTELANISGQVSYNPTTAQSTLISLSASPTSDPFYVPGAPGGLTIRSVNDSNNSISLTDSGQTLTLYVIGYNGTSVLLSGVNPASSVANAIHYGTANGGGLLLYALSLNGKDLGADPAGTVLNWDALAASTSSVSAALSAYQNGTLTPASPATISDTAADVQANLDGLRNLAYARELSSITLTDAGTPTITLTATQYSNDYIALTYISSSYAIEVTGASVQTAGSYALDSSVQSVAVSDTASDVVAYLTSLQSLAQSKKLAGITLTDGGIPTLSLDFSQGTSDAAALNAITSNFSVTQTVSVANATVTGISAALGNTAILSGPASSYTITPSGDGVSFTVSSNGSIDHLSDIQALKFSDYTLIVAQTPGANTVTTGNITNIYAAVLDREPDVAGLSYYQKLLLANPTTPMSVFALDFLNSPEYTGTHIYAQTTAGDAQFITDTYNNLLHRGPASGDVAWYQANVLAPYLKDAAPGTAAYTTAEMNAHAALLVDFSNSAEFVKDVQVTGTTPASAQHWLVLI